MKNFTIFFLHTDGSNRKVTIEAFNKERAFLRFLVNWGSEMGVLNIV